MISESKTVNTNELCALALGLKTYRINDEPEPFFILVGEATLARFEPSMIEADALLVVRELGIEVLESVESGKWVAKLDSNSCSGNSMCEAVSGLAATIGAANHKR